MAHHPTPATYADILALASQEQAPICEALRALVIQLHPGRVELAWPAQKIVSFGLGPKKMTEHYAYLAVQGAHLNLGFYQGAALPDPEGLLEGSGKKLRHIKIRTLAEVGSPAVRALLSAAIDERVRALGGNPRR